LKNVKKKKIGVEFDSIEKRSVEFSQLWLNSTEWPGISYTEFDYEISIWRSAFEI
jgi:hypothetical protein